MSLTGHLSDLSLSELIEFFCNQRKTGCLNVLYPQGHGSFYLQTGSVVDAKIGVLRGIDAVYYALTLPNAAFEFKGSSETLERTINQPWTQVVLEGLRRLDEGITPTDAFPNGPLPDAGGDVSQNDNPDASRSNSAAAEIPAFLSGVNGSSSGRRKPLIAGAIAVAILASVVVIGVPAGWYRRSKPAVSVTANAVSLEAQPVTNSETPTDSPTATPEVDTQAVDAATLAAKRQRERERAKAREGKANDAAGNPNSTGAPPTASSNPETKPGPRKVTVQVTYDESGRVIQASGADPTALRIARQKHFPPGKGGTATITIPIN
jgi:hypothetical protein